MLTTLLIACIDHPVIRIKDYSGRVRVHLDFLGFFFLCEIHTRTPSPKTTHTHTHPHQPTHTHTHTPTHTHTHTHTHPYTHRLISDLMTGPWLPRPLLH